MPNVQIYTKMGCGYCVRALALLRTKGVTFEEIDVTLSAEARREMIERAPDHRTTPSIFIDGKHIGGSDDLAALAASGELDRLITDPADDASTPGPGHALP